MLQNSFDYALTCSWNLTWFSPRGVCLRPWTHLNKTKSCQVILKCLAKFPCNQNSSKNHSTLIKTLFLQSFGYPYKTLSSSCWVWCCILKPLFREITLSDKKKKKKNNTCIIWSKKLGNVFVRFFFFFLNRVSLCRLVSM